MKMMTVLVVLLVTGLAISTATSAQQATPQLTQNAPGDAAKASLENASSPATPERFLPLLGRWEYAHPTLWTKWVIRTVREDGTVEIDYYFKGVLTTMGGVAEIRNERDKNLIHLTLKGGYFNQVRWELDYYPNGGTLTGKVFGGGGETSATVYRPSK